MKINTFAAWKQSVVAGGVVVWLAQAALASVPLNNLEGAGGVAFNPLAYPSGQNKDAASSNNSKRPKSNNSKCLSNTRNNSRRLICNHNNSKRRTNNNIRRNRASKRNEQLVGSNW